MDALTIFISTHPVVTYVALTFAISWGGVLVVRCDGLGLTQAQTTEATPR